MTQSPVLLLDLSLRCCGYAVVSFPFTFDDAGILHSPLVSQVAGISPYGEFKLENPRASAQERLGLLSALLERVIEAYRPLLVAAEMPRNMYQSRSGGPSVSNNASVMLQQKCFGMAMALCWSIGVPFVEVDPALSKQLLTGKRTADKRTVALCLARRVAGVDPEAKRIAWPKGWTEAVRDALAVIFYLEYRRNLFPGPGNDWLDRILAEQDKPDAGDHRPWRKATYAELQAEVRRRHGANAGGAGASQQVAAGKTKRPRKPLT